MVKPTFKAFSGGSLDGAIKVRPHFAHKGTVEAIKRGSYFANRTKCSPLRKDDIAQPEGKVFRG